MKRHFYTHLLDITTIHAHFDRLHIVGNERRELLEIAHMTIHHAVVGGILDVLKDPQKKNMIVLIEQNAPHEHIWTLLRAHVPDPEHTVQQLIGSVIDHLCEDVAGLEKSSEIV